jgi:DNA-binding MarR family transcriptional regulator
VPCNPPSGAIARRIFEGYRKNMKHQEITTLKLIQSLDKEPEQTQRDLASELNVSLGLVNAFIKRLLNKGYFKIKTIPKNRIRYILTPEGMCEKNQADLPILAVLT